MLQIEQVALKAESIVLGVAVVLPQHQQVLDVLQQKIALTEEKAKFAKDVVAQAVATVQVAVGIVP